LGCIWGDAGALSASLKPRISAALITLPEMVHFGSIRVGRLYAGEIAFSLCGFANKLPVSATRSSPWFTAWVSSSRSPRLSTWALAHSFPYAGPPPRCLWSS
jgi:hypothetical protein